MCTSKIQITRVKGLLLGYAVENSTINTKEKGQADDSK